MLVPATCGSGNRRGAPGRRQGTGFDTPTALGAMTGTRYRERLKDVREVWLDGEKVQDVTIPSAFTGVVDE
jgi:hypothetical protein